MTHREIQRNVLGLAANPRGGGFIAMYILHAYGIPGDLKGALAQEVSAGVRSQPNRTRRILRRVRDFKRILDAQVVAIRNGEVSPNPLPRFAKREVRYYQRAFREVVLSNYGRTCAMCSISTTELLVASHIAPWATHPQERLLPTNAMALCVLHDRLFELGYLAVSEDGRIEKSPYLPDLGGFKIPDRIRNAKEFAPGARFLELHRKERFKA